VGNAGDVVCLLDQGDLVIVLDDSGTVHG
jgi:hypothetical protein